jgi:hypothetical protein
MFRVCPARGSLGLDPSSVFAGPVTLLRSRPISRAASMSEILLDLNRAAVLAGVLDAVLEQAEMLAEIDQRAALVGELELDLADLAGVLAAAVEEILDRLGDRRDSRLPAAPIFQLFGEGTVKDDTHRLADVGCCGLVHGTSTQMEARAQIRAASEDSDVGFARWAPSFK